MVQIKKLLLLWIEGIISSEIFWPLMFPFRWQQNICFFTWIYLAKVWKLFSSIYCQSCKSKAWKIANNVVKIYSINPLTGTGCVERDFQQLLKNHLIGWDGKPENGLKSNNNKFQSPIENNLLFTMQSPLCIKLFAPVQSSHSLCRSK